MNTTTRDFLIGLTAMLGLAGIATLMVLFGEWGFGARDRYNLYLVLDDATGVTGASRITLNGVRVGILDDMENMGDPREGVRLALKIDPEVRIPRDVQIVLERGLVGEATLAMRTGPLEPGQPAPGFLGRDEEIRIDASSMFDEIRDEITLALEQRLDSLSAAADSFDELSRTLTEVSRKAEDMFEARTPEEVDAGLGPANLTSTVARLDASLASAQAWLDDEELRADADQAISKAADVIDQVSEAVTDWSSAARTLEARAEQVGQDSVAALQEFAQATRSANEVMADVRAITAGIQRGEGTVGMLIQNPDLYRSLNDAAIRLEKALTEAQLMIEKYRKEGVPIQF